MNKSLGPEIIELQILIVKEGKDYLAIFLQQQIEQKSTSQIILGSYKPGKEVLCDYSHPPRQLQCQLSVVWSSELLCT